MNKLLTLTFALLLVAGFAPAQADMEDCPVTFSSCEDVQGKSCRFETGDQCTTIDTGEHNCRLPDNSILHCGGLTVQVQTCGCKTRLQLICCPECEEFFCGDCESQQGSQSFFCG
jgi:hypothetical protein